MLSPRVLNSPVLRHPDSPFRLSHLRDLCALLFNPIRVYWPQFAVPDKSGQIRTKTYPPPAHVAQYQRLRSGHFSFVRTPSESKARSAGLACPAETRNPMETYATLRKPPEGSLAAEATRQIPQTTDKLNN